MKQILKNVLITIFCLSVAVTSIINTYFSIARYKVQVKELQSQTQLLEKLLEEKDSR